MFKRLNRWLGGIGLTAWLAAANLGTAAAELVMFDQPSCPWCARWDRDIAPIYGKPASGQRAPLRRIDITAKRPDDLKSLGGIRYTPTFVLIDRGAEIGRIVGYTGEDQFWGLGDELVAKLKPAGD